MSTGKMSEFFEEIEKTKNFDELMNIIDSIADKYQISLGNFYATLYKIKKNNLLNESVFKLFKKETLKYLKKIFPTTQLSARKNMRCMICDTPLFPYSVVKPSHHHVDYIENIFIKVCDICHFRLHRGDLINHRFGINNIVWKCPNCGKEQIGAPYSECGQGLIPGTNGYLHDEQRIRKRRSDAGLKKV